MNWGVIFWYFCLITFQDKYFDVLMIFSHFSALVVSWLIVLEVCSLYWRNFAIPHHGYHPHVLQMLGLHYEPLHHYHVLNRPNSLPQGEGWGTLILASENPGNKNSSQSLLMLNIHITSNVSFKRHLHISHFEVARVEMVVKVHCGTVSGDKFAAMLKMRPPK